MSKRPQDTSAEEPNGGNLHVRFRGGPELGNRLGLLNKNLQHILKGSILLGLIAFASGCVVAEPRDGYYEREHHRYYREHSWHECHEHDEYCR